MQTLKKRVDNYTAKIVGDVVKNRIGIARDFQSRNYAKQARQLMIVEETVREVVGVDILVMFYMSFARQIWRIYRKYRGKALETELDIAFYTWESRGLVREKLDKINKKIRELKK